MSSNIPKVLHGYLEVGGDWNVFVTNDHHVRLLPTSYDDIGFESFFRSFAKMRDQETDVLEYLYGLDESRYSIAFLSRGCFTPHTCGTSFFSPIIVRSSGNTGTFHSSLSSEWNKFDAIYFSGGIIDCLYNPKIVALDESTTKRYLENLDEFDGSRTIGIRPFDDYTRYSSVALNNQKAELFISVLQDLGEGRLNTTDLGTLESFIALRFESPQDLLSVHKYVNTIQSALAILAGQTNITFDVSLKQKIRKKYMNSASCKIFREYDEFYSPERHRTIEIEAIFEYLPRMIELVDANDANAIIDLLPESNQNRDKVSIIDIQELCTALEVEYLHYSSLNPSTKDKAIQDLKKEIRDTIDNFMDNNAEFSVFDETNIGSCFKYLDLTLKGKIFALYQDYECVVSSIIAKHSLPEMDINDVERFAGLRHSKLHSGQFLWNDSVKHYTRLYALAFVCFYSRVGMPKVLLLA